MLCRELWGPSRHAVALGVSIGLVVAMLPPIPIQMLLAAVLAVLLRANIPIAAAACWFSNPVTWAPLLVLQKSIGDRVLGYSAVDGLHPSFHPVRCIALGSILMAIVLAPLGYGLVHALWDAVHWTFTKLRPLAVSKPDGQRQVMVKRPTASVVGETLNPEKKRSADPAIPVER